MYIVRTTDDSSPYASKSLDIETEIDMTRINPLTSPSTEERCEEHPAYEKSNCPVCGTSRQIGAF